MKNMKIRIKKIKEITDQYYKLLLNADPSKKLVDDYLKRSWVYEAVAFGKLAGIIVLLPTRPETLEIVNLSVSKKFQRHGIGTHLVQYAIKFGQINGYHTLEVGTGTTSFGPLYLYQKCGFRMISIDRDFFSKNYSKPLIENNLLLKDMVRLRLDIKSI